MVCKPDSFEPWHNTKPCSVRMIKHMVRIAKANPDRTLTRPPRLHCDIRAGGRTDSGLVRRRNEDRLFMDSQSGLYIVSDGLGGHAAGEVAADLVVRLLPRAVATHLAGWKGKHEPVVEEAMRQALNAVNQALCERADADQTLVGMGATATACLVHGQNALLANVGDSPAFLIRDGYLERLSAEHTLTGLLVQIGHISSDAAAKHFGRNHLTQFMGMAEPLSPHVAFVALRPGDRLLLCSDGLTGELSSAQIVSLLNDYPDPSDGVNALVEAARTAGGRDNITVILLDVAAHV